MHKYPRFTLFVWITLLIVLFSVNSLLTNFPHDSYDFYDSKVKYNLNQVNDFKILVYNIEASGIDPDWKEVVKEENADIFVAVETGDWDDAGGDGFDNTDFNNLVTEFNNYFTDEDPYVGVTTQEIGSQYSGEAVLSRFPIISTTQIPIVKLDNGASYYVSHDFFDVEVSIGGTNVHIIASHLKCCQGPSEEEKRERAQEGIINYMDDLGNVPIVYAGDLNSFSPEDIGINPYQSGLGYGPCTMLVDPDDPTYGQYSSTIHSWIDVHRELNPSDLGITYGFSYNSRIDFIYVNQFFFGDILNSTTGDTAHASSGSDHYSVDVFIQDFNDSATETSETVKTTTTITMSISETTSTRSTPAIDWFSLLISLSLSTLVISRIKRSNL